MNRKVFFSEKRANEFVRTLKGNDIENAKIWVSKDSFGQNIFTVEWGL